MNLLRKNQVVITALVIIAIIAGYLSYTQKNRPEDAQTSNNKPNKEIFQEGNDEDDIQNGQGVVDDKNTNDKDVTNKGYTSTDTSKVSEAVYVTQLSENEYFIQAKLNKEQAREEGRETYLGIINNINLTEAQKNEAILQMLIVAHNVEIEATAENLLMAIGFTKTMVTINETTVYVVVTTDRIDDQSRAQIEDIVKRATGFEVEKMEKLKFTN